ncbi:uncharacterized protein [Trachinotus anak]|uniref:uncharacterized protein isoform X1 n=1 Tax=Trachinotus anak TaxID=443729 RepID=UPI0039F1DE4A
MSAAWIKLTTVLCLICTAQSDPESSKVVWKNFGEAITIQCRTSQNAEEFLSLSKGLNEEVQIIYKEKSSGKDNIASEFTSRLQLNGAFPNVDILIKNLTSADTGPYWCVYKRFNKESAEFMTTKGNGSVLLVVTAPSSANADEEAASSPSSADAKQACETTHLNLVLACVVVSAAVLLIFILIALVWIFIKTKKLRSTAKPRPVATNDVYEDMRGTLRH